MWEETLGAAPEVLRAEAELRRLEARMSEPAVYGDAASFERTLAAYGRAQAAFEELDGYAYESRVREALQTLGLPEEAFSQPVGTLSGGQKKMVGLAKLLAARANVLLLDEPDNHLDLRAKAYLEAFISGFPGTVVIISHDRYLLDQTVDWIAEIEAHRLAEYAGNYTAYAVEKQLRLLRQQQMYEAQQKEIARIEDAIPAFSSGPASWSTNATPASPHRQKMLDRMERIERPSWTGARWPWTWRAGAARKRC